MADVFFNLSKKYKVKLTLIGATTDVIDYFSGVDIQICSWGEDTEVQHIKTFDIGIMPLESGPWEKGKCGYKLIQYMACSVPVVASPVGVNIDLVNDNQCGLIASTYSDWEQQLTKLILDSQLRNKFGTNGRDAVYNIYSLQSQSPCLLSIINLILRE